MQTTGHAARATLPGTLASPPQRAWRARLDRLLRRSEVYQFFAGGRRMEPMPVRLTHRRVFILPTAHGVVFGLSILLMLVGSANYALGLGFALAFLLAGISIAGLIHTFRNLIGLSVSIGRNEPVFAGDTARFELHVENTDRRARHAIVAQRDTHETTFDVPSRDWARATLAIPAHRRGWLDLGRVTLLTRYPLGLFRTWSYVRPAARVLVYPRPEITPLPDAHPLDHAGHGTAVAAGSDDYTGLREYQPGDSPRHIAWKAVARADAIVTKQFSDPGATELMLDWSLLPARQDTEFALSRLAGWVLQAERSGRRYGLAIPGTMIEPGQGAAHEAQCLRALALHGLPDAAP